MIPHVRPVLSTGAHVIPETLKKGPDVLWILERLMGGNFLEPDSKGVAFLEREKLQW